MKKKPHAESTAYAKAGVSLKAGDVFSAFAGKVGKASFGNSPYVEVLDNSKGHFRGPRGWRYRLDQLPAGCFQVGAPDGIGTATIIVSAAGEYPTASSRLLAMTAGDITRFGGLPLVFINMLETKTLGTVHSNLFAAYKTMMHGLGDYAAKQRYVLMGGETAEMGVCVSSEITGVATKKMPVFNWSGVMLGLGHPDKLITGASLKPGQSVIALRDKLRSNGGSMARSFLREDFGTDWWSEPAAVGTILEMASPAALYDLFLATMNGWYDPSFKPHFKMHAIAHLSGGGIRTKFAEDILFPLGLSASLPNLWMPPTFMAECARRFNMGNEEAYTVFGGGQGVLVVVDNDRAEAFCQCAFDWGIDARVAGYIDKRRRVPRLEIDSKFSMKTFTMR